MSEMQYTGSCQCGAVSFEADLDLDKTITCNCSRCQKLGSVLAFAPISKFTLKSGKDNLTEYRFHKMQVSHLFCKTCGIQSFGQGKMPDGTEIAAVNVNCLDGVNPRELTSHHYDGKAL